MTAATSEAIAFFKKALALAHDVSGNGSLQTAGILAALGVALGDVGDLQGGRELIEQSL